MSHYSWPCQVQKKCAHHVKNPCLRQLYYSQGRLLSHHQSYVPFFFVIFFPSRKQFCLGSDTTSQSVENHEETRILYVPIFGAKIQTFEDFFSNFPFLEFFHIFTYCVNSKVLFSFNLELKSFGKAKHLWKTFLSKKWWLITASWSTRVFLDKGQKCFKKLTYKNSMLLHFF